MGLPSRPCKIRFGAHAISQFCGAASPVTARRACDGEGRRSSLTSPTWHRSAALRPTRTFLSAKLLPVAERLRRCRTALHARSGDLALALHQQIWRACHAHVQGQAEGVRGFRTSEESRNFCTVPLDWANLQNSFSAHAPPLDTVRGCGFRRVVTLASATLRRTPVIGHLRRQSRAGASAGCSRRRS